MSPSTRRAMLVLLVALGPLAVASSAHAQVAGAAADSPSIRGVIRGRFQERVGPLPHALVEVLTPDGRRSILADEEGRYTFVALPVGEARLVVTHAGYTPLTLLVTVPDGGPVEVDLELAASPLALPTIQVRAHAPALLDAVARTSIRPAAPDQPELEVQALELGPGVGHPGLAEAVGALPGNDPANPTDVLYMRGSTADLKLVLLDGVPVYTPFHVAGLMRSFEPGLLGRADLHVGGAPARFDGGLTHILDLRTRAPRFDRLRASAAVDLVTASAALEAPLGARTGILASGRALHDLGRVPLGARRPYGYGDALVTLSAEPMTGHRLKATGFANSESVVLDAAGAPGDARWSNRAAAGSYLTSFGGAEVEFTGGLSAYRATLPLQPSTRPGEPIPPALLATARTDRGRFVVEATWGDPAQPTRIGTSLDQMDVTYAARALDGSPGVSRDGSITAIGAFVDATRLVATGLTLRTGLRVDAFSGTGARLSPRGALLWELGPEALLTIAAGRYHQPTRSPFGEVERTMAEVAGADTTGVRGGLLPVATADHVVLSLDQRLGERVDLGLEGFWKRYSGLPDGRGETVRNSGIDVRVLGAGQSGTVWLGYSLSWFWSTLDLTGRASDFVGRHLLSAGLSGALPGPLRGELRLAYGAGLPYTSVPFGQTALTVVQSGPGDQTLQRQPLTAGLDDEFLRVDLEVHMLFEPEWGGRAWQVRPYVRLLNALDRRDALFYAFQPWRSDRVTPLAQRPVLPLVGLAVSF